MKKAKSKLIAQVLVENKMGFKVPRIEKVELFSYNKTRKSLEKEWAQEGKQAIRAALSDRNVIKVESIRFTDLNGVEIK